MTSRKKFIESHGATCRNWNWSWSFVNHEKKFVIFGLWDTHHDGLIYSLNWKGKGSKQSLEHIKLIEEQGYQLKTFSMQHYVNDEGKTVIKSFEPKLEDKQLIATPDKWYAASENQQTDLKIPEEVKTPEKYIEGATTTVSINAYERNPKARAKCISHYGCQCYVCEFDFKAVYGDIGKDFIHVHHEVPLANIKQEYEVDPIKDLKPLCPNCHAIIHRTHPPLAVDKLIKILRRE